ncbi:MAG: peptide ABC transporter substrate-binding protein [Anaerolineae bacterium]|nr:peptide ABC transporter substrate-binding protein [Anaerolineae bacterium]
MKLGPAFVRFLLVFLSTCLLAACQMPVASPTPAPSPSPSPVPPTATPVPTPLPPAPVKELIICQMEEPNTLFIYGGPSRAARNVLQAIYDGPIDSLNYRFQPVILEKVPSLADGDASFRPVQVQEGSRVVNADGRVVELRPGVAIFDAFDQKVTFEGGTATMAQLVVTFTLRAGISWADGQPLTADDSRYSFELASELDYPPARMLVERTAAYEVVNERTVVWSGLPGYRDPLYFLNFYHPLPRHIWGVASGQQLLNAEIAHRKPLGWGAFAVEEWVEGDHITLVRNPRYFRAAEGLPYLDRVIIRFVPSLRQALDMLTVGGCDLIAQDLVRSGDPEVLWEAAVLDTVELVSAPGNEWEHLDFGIARADPQKRIPFFRDVRVRQAVARCIDRERIAREAFPYTAAIVAHSYVPPDHPLYAGDRLSYWGYDPLAAQALLEEVGWRDGDGDGTREAHGVAGIADWTPFAVTLLTTAEQPARALAANIIADNLALCGIKVDVRHMPVPDFFADGPDGPVFGRQFDLALFSWLNGFAPPCELYLSSEIPRPENWWSSSNNPGYSSADYDAACHSALYALPGMESHVHFHLEAQRIFSHDLPVLPLYFVPDVVAIRPGVSGVVLNPSQYLELWNIEAFDLQR